MVVAVPATDCSGLHACSPRPERRMGTNVECHRFRASPAQDTPIGHPFVALFHFDPDSNGGSVGRPRTLEFASYRLSFLRLEKHLTALESGQARGHMLLLIALVGSLHEQAAKYCCCRCGIADEQQLDGRVRVLRSPMPVMPATVASLAYRRPNV